MPFKKKTAEQPTKKTKMVASQNKNNKKINPCCSLLTHKHCSGFGHTLVKVLGGILLVYLIFYIGTLINNNLQKSKYIGMAPKQERTIQVAGYGKIVGSNDIAVTTIGYSNTSTDVATAQANNKKIMDAVLKDLKNMGIKEKDIQSNYSVYPQYNYTNSGRKFGGYQVNHQMKIKIRNLSTVSNVLTLAGKYGANQVGGLNFTVDDNESLKSQARIKALADAKNKAQVIANYLGVSLGKAVSYNEYENNKTYYPIAKTMVEGLGGTSAPEVSTGSSNVEMNVNVIYEIK